MTPDPKSPTTDATEAKISHEAKDAARTWIDCKRWGALTQYDDLAIIIQRAIDSEVARACAERDQTITNLSTEKEAYQWESRMLETERLATRAQLAEARKDSMRLDWLEKTGPGSYGWEVRWSRSGPTALMLIQVTHETHLTATIRAAIDAASNDKQGEP